MNNSPQQIAEALARKCAEQVWRNDASYIEMTMISFVEEYYKTILQSIPLVELLELRDSYVNAYLDEKIEHENRNRLLHNLTTKLKQQGIIE